MLCRICVITVNYHIIIRIHFPEHTCNHMPFAGTRFRDHFCSTLSYDCCGAVCTVVIKNNDFCFRNCILEIMDHFANSYFFIKARNQNDNLCFIVNIHKFQKKSSCSKFIFFFDTSQLLFNISVFNI